VFGFSLLVVAAAATAPLVPVAPSLSEARTVVEAQLNAPPRSARAGGLTSEEAAIVERLYLQSIGKRIEQDKGNRGQGTQAR
jgi:hypothetical protein